MGNFYWVAKGWIRTVFKFKEKEVKIKFNQENKVPNVSADKGNTIPYVQNIKTGLTKSLCTLLLYLAV
jgi:hypothetical protein